MVRTCQHLENSWSRRRNVDFAARWKSQREEFLPVWEERTNIAGNAITLPHKSPLGQRLSQAKIYNKPQQIESRLGRKEEVLFTEMLVNRAEIDFQLDTRATLSIISVNVLPSITFRPTATTFVM